MRFIKIILLKLKRKHMWIPKYFDRELIQLNNRLSIWNNCFQYVTIIISCNIHDNKSTKLIKHKIDIII